MRILPAENEELSAIVRNQNIGRQYGVLINSITIGIEKGPSSFDKYLMWTLNHVAVANLHDFGGRFREGNVSVGDHKPPPHQKVDALIDDFILTIQKNWDQWNVADLASYGLWRLNWIHPFFDGNGRTARAVCYFIFCVRVGMLLPGDTILPERIRHSREKCVSILKSVDKSFKEGKLDLSEMSSYINDLVTEQLSNKSIRSDDIAKIT